MSTTNGKPDIRLDILCLSGSLRAASLNKAALQALKRAAPAKVRVREFERVGELPLFNPDDEQLEIPVLTELRQSIIAADVLVLASPEYAHGISGAMKNLLDHLVSGEEFVELPVVLINTSPRASHAQTALREVLCTMSAQIIDEACLELPLLGSGLNCAQIARDQSVIESLERMLQTLLEIREG